MNTPTKPEFRTAYFLKGIEIASSTIACGTERTMRAIAMALNASKDKHRSVSFKVLPCTL